MHQRRPRPLSAAGMNDYISKPIDPELLASTLEHWLTPKRSKIARPERKQSPTKSSRPTGENQALPKQLIGFDIESALKRLYGNEEIFIKIALDFPEKLQSLRRDPIGPIYQ